MPDTGWAKRAAERRTSPTCFPVRGHSVESREVPRFMSKVKLGRHVSEDSQLTYTSERSSGSVNECISEYRSLFLFFFYFLIFFIFNNLRTISQHFQHARRVPPGGRAQPLPASHQRSPSSPICTRREVRRVRATAAGSTANAAVRQWLSSCLYARLCLTPTSSHGARRERAHEDE